MVDLYSRDRYKNNFIPKLNILLAGADQNQSFSGFMGMQINIKSSGDIACKNSNMTKK